MQYALIPALALCAVAAQAIPQQSSTQRKIPCKTPEIAASCYWTHGRLAIYDGNPSWRMWKVGTTRMLGIHSGPHPTDPLDSEHPEFPANLTGVVATMGDGDRIFADFEVCPLKPEHPGWMQPSCIESAKNIFLDRFHP